MRIKHVLLTSTAALLLTGCDDLTTSSSPTNSATASTQSAAASVLTTMSREKAAEYSPISMDYEKFVLDNGLRVIVHEDRKAPIVAVSVWYGVGSKDEPTGKTGFAHLFEHLMFNGSENYDDEYFGPFEKVGATDMNGTTWFDRTNYFQNIPTPALDMALWMESDRMGHLLGAVTQEKLDEQRGVVQNEKRQGDNQPYGKTQYSILEGLYPVGHPYRHSTIGSLEDLDAASLEDVKQWFEDYYGAANTVIVLAGDIDAATAKPLMEKYFGDIPAGPPVAKMESWVPEKSTSQTEVMYDRVPQARIYRSWTVPGRLTQENPSLRLAASTLGSGKNSPLYKSLVYDKQWATGASASVEQHNLASVFRILVTLKPDADIDEVNAEVDRILAEYLDAGPSSGALERAKTKINAGRIRGYEKIGGFGGKATALAEGELYAGDPSFFYGAHLGWLNNASTSDVKAVANKWLSRGYYQLNVMPFPEYSTLEPGVDRSAGLPDVGAMPKLAFPEIQRGELSNGMKVVLAERNSVPMVNISLQFDAGYAADAGGKLGVSSFAMDMLNEGTATRSALEISEEAETLGANLSAGSNLDTSTASISALKDNLDASVDLLADILINPSFEQTEMDRLKKQWQASIQQEKNQPVGLALRNLPPLMYGKDHAYGIPFTGSGTEASVESMTRDDLVNFKAQWIRPDNGTVFVVGDTSMDDIKPVLEKHFGGWKTPDIALKTKNIATVNNPTTSTVYVIDKKGSPQSLILAGQLVPPTGDANNITLSAMNEALGGAFTARVNMNLREDKGWSYGAFTFMQDAKGQQPWFLYAPVQSDRTGDSMKELMREVTDYLGPRPVTQDELTKVIKSNTNSLPGSYETMGSVMGAMMSNERFGRGDDYVPSLSAKYAALNVDAVMASAKQNLNPNSMTWVIVGDRDAIEAQVRDANVGEIRFMDVDGNIVE